MSSRDRTLSIARHPWGDVFEETRSGDPPDRRRIVRRRRPPRAAPRAPQTRPKELRFPEARYARSQFETGHSEELDGINPPPSDAVRTRANDYHRERPRADRRFATDFTLSRRDTVKKRNPRFCAEERRRSQPLGLRKCRLARAAACLLDAAPGAVPSLSLGNETPTLYACSAKTTWKTESEDIARFFSRDFYFLTKLLMYNIYYKVGFLAKSHLASRQNTRWCNTEC